MPEGACAAIVRHVRVFVREQLAVLAGVVFEATVREVVIGSGGHGGVLFVGVVEAALAVPASTASLMASAMLKICKFSMKRFGSSSRLTLKRLRQVFCKVRAMVLPSKAMESPKTSL